MSGFDDENERTIVSKVKVESVNAGERYACLHLERGPGAPRSFQLRNAATTIGRDPAADICLEGGEYSRRHARIVRVGEAYMVLDTESANGVFVNGVKVHSAALYEGDQVQVGSAVFLFRGH